MTLQQDVPAAVELHPDVVSVRLVGSRAEGRATPLSDWDFKVDVRRFDRVRAEIESLVAPLEALATQWDPFGSVQTFMLMLRGPVKVDLIFAEPLTERAPWDPNADDPAAIDMHFWDWILWLGGKDRAGRRELVESELEKLHRHLLGPLGVAKAPESVEDAVERYTDAVRRLRWNVPATLADEVRSGLSRAGYRV